MDRHDTLLPPNATWLEQGLAKAAARITDVPTPLGTLWNAETCSAEHLPWLAWALGLKNWSADWPEDIKRARVKSAISVAQRKGTARAVRDVVASFGASIALREWWESSPRGKPHTFDITLLINAGLPHTASYQRDIMDAVNNVKPARSHYTLTAGMAMTAKLSIAAYARPVTYRRLILDA